VLGSFGLYGPCPGNMIAVQKPIPMNRKWIHTALLVLGLLFLVLMLRIVGVERVWHALASLGWGLVPLVLLEGLGEVMHTNGWRRCLCFPFRSQSVVRLFWIRMAGYAINYFTPTAALGGEVTRVSLVAPAGRTAEATSTVLIDKACMALAHLLLVVVGAGLLLLGGIRLPPVLQTTMLVSGSVIAAGIIAFMLIQKEGKLGAVLRWRLVQRLAGTRSQKIADNTAAVDEALRIFYRDRRSDLALAVIWHMGGYAASLLQTWLFFTLLGLHPGFVVVAGVWIIGLWFDLVVFLVPMSAGTLEGSRIVTFAAVGYSAVQGMTLGMVVRLGHLSWAVLGLISYAVLAFKPGDPSLSPARNELSTATRTSVPGR
jgi:uncharacterized protein (TIRG00374 family)